LNPGISSTDFIKSMLEVHGDLLSNNKSKAQQMKYELLRTKTISERLDSKFHKIYKV